MSAPLISVLMTVYNAERYLDAAVGSILKQTFGDFEFIIIDDGSTDGSLNVLRRYESRDSRIRLISRPNTGYGKALNEALAMARGEFVARMDADDMSASSRFESQVKFLRDHPEVLVVGASVDLIDGDSRLLLHSPQPTGDEEIQNALLAGRTLIVHSATMIRRAEMVEAGGYDPELCPSEDLDLWLRLGERGKLANLADVLGKYRLHTTSVCATNPSLQKNNSRIAAERAWKRRGIEGAYQWVEPSRATGGSQSRYEFTLKYGWWAFQSAQRRTALLYAWRAVRQTPWRMPGWRLMLCAAVKPMTVLS